MAVGDLVKTTLGPKGMVRKLPVVLVDFIELSLFSFSRIKFFNVV